MTEARPEDLSSGSIPGSKKDFTPSPLRPTTDFINEANVVPVSGGVTSGSDQSGQEIRSGFVPKAPEPILAHKDGMSRGAKVGSLAAAGVLAAAGGVALAYESGVFDSGSTDQAKVQIIPAPEQPANIPGTEIPNPLKTPEPTVNAVAPTVAATATPEKKAEVPCQIMPQEFCNGGKVIEMQYQGNTYRLLAFTLPDGTPLYSPESGQLIKGVFNGVPLTGPFGVIKPNADKSFYFVGDLKFENNNTVDVKPGDPVARIQKTGVTNFGEYNLIIMANRLDATGKKPEADKEILDALFPSLSKVEPVKKVDQSAGQSSVGSPIYSNTPFTTPVGK